jgi:hypothetical protein
MSSRIGCTEKVSPMAAWPAAASSEYPELGYVEGKDFVIEWRSAEGKYERLPDVAAELVQYIRSGWYILDSRLQDWLFGPTSTDTPRRAGERVGRRRHSQFSGEGKNGCARVISRPERGRFCTAARSEVAVR